MTPIRSTLPAHCVALVFGAWLLGAGCPPVQQRGYFELIIPCDATTPCPASTGDAGTLECVTIDDPRVRGICARPCTSGVVEDRYHVCVGWTGTSFAAGAPGYLLPNGIDGAYTGNDAIPILYPHPAGGYVFVMMPRALEP